MKTDKTIELQLAKIFKKGRVDADLTQAEVSEVLGYSSSQFLSNFERGLCNLPLNKLGTLIRLYKLDGEKVVRLVADLQTKFIRSELLLQVKKRRA